MAAREALKMTGIVIGQDFIPVGRYSNVHEF